LIGNLIHHLILLMSTRVIFNHLIIYQVSFKLSIKINIGIGLVSFIILDQCLFIIHLIPLLKKRIACNRQPNNFYLGFIKRVSIVYERVQHV
jgi:hypothetical protein